MNFGNQWMPAAHSAILLPMASITIYGAAGTVTGSRSMLKTGEHRVLVDCELVQGAKAIGARILHHLRRWLPDECNLVVLTGYQSCGTPGWRALQGEKSLGIDGKDMPAHVGTASIRVLSDHPIGDQFLHWVHKQSPTKTMLVNHGEPKPAQALADKLTKEIAQPSETPRHGDSFEI